MNADNWEIIDSVAANDQTYGYDGYDNSPRIGDNQYQVRIRKYNNTYTYSPVKHLRYDAINQELDIYPNPATNKIVVNGEFSTGSILQILDLSGRLIWVKKLENNNHVEVVLPKISRGIYFLQLNNRVGKLIVR